MLPLNRVAGDAAKDAFNVFFHLSYEGAVDLDSVLDPVQRAAMRSQIGQWGQIPTQMFNKPHVHREPLIVSPHGVKPPKASPSKIFRIEGFDDASVSASSLFVVGEGRSVVVVASDHTTHQLVLTCKDQVSLHPLAVTSASTDLGGSPTHPNSPTMPNAVAWSASGRYVITGNHWDGSVRFYRFGSLSSQAGGSNPFLKLAAYSLLQCLRTHEGRVVSVSLSPCQRLLACGSSDCTVSLWKVSLDDGFSRVPHIEERPSSILVGHDSSVVCVAINSDMVCGRPRHCYVIADYYTFRLGRVCQLLVDAGLLVAPSQHRCTYQTNHSSGERHPEIGLYLSACLHCC